MEEGAAEDYQGRSEKQLDILKRHGVPMMLAIAGGQTAAQAYMSVRSSLPKVKRLCVCCAFYIAVQA